MGKTVNEKVLVRYEVLLGFNTKQWWVYDNELNVYIDIPSEVLEQASKIDDQDKQQDFIYEEIMKEPTWLNDSEYFYDEDMEI